MFKINNEDKDRSGIFIVNFEHISYNYFIITYLIPCFSVSIVNFEQVNAGWYFNLTKNGRGETGKGVLRFFYIIFHRESSRRLRHTFIQFHLCSSLLIRSPQDENVFCFNYLSRT